MGVRKRHDRRSERAERYDEWENRSSAPNYSSVAPIGYVHVHIGNHTFSTPSNALPAHATHDDFDEANRATPRSNLHMERMNRNRVRVATNTTGIPSRPLADCITRNPVPDPGIFAAEEVGDFDDDRSVTIIKQITVMKSWTEIKEKMSDVDFARLRAG